MTNLFLYINLPTVEITTIIIPMFIQWGGLTKALFAMYFTNFFLSRETQAFQPGLTRLT